MPKYNGENDFRLLVKATLKHLIEEITKRYDEGDHNLDAYFDYYESTFIKHSWSIANKKKKRKP